MSYSDSYKSCIEELITTLPPLDIRAKKIKEINEVYFGDTGENLPNYLLELLGTWYLKEIYSDKAPNKTRLEEYPILSEHQEKRRDRRRVLVAEEDSLATLNYHLKNNSHFTKSQSEKKGA